MSKISKMSKMSKMSKGKKEEEMLREEMLLGEEIIAPGHGQTAALALRRDDTEDRMDGAQEPQGPLPIRSSSL